MRSLIITLHVNKPAVLPLAYNELVQGLLYSCWREEFPDLHDAGFGSSKPFRLFTFGPLAGKHSIDGAAKTICFRGPISFEVRSPIEELMTVLARQLAKRDHVRLGSNFFELANLQSCDRLMFPSRCIVRAPVALVAHATLEDGHTRYYSPSEPEWLSLIQRNVASKAEIFSMSSDNAFTVIPRTETLRKCVTRFKGTYVTGWSGDYIIAGDSDVVSMLYHTGLGTKNSQGFGMFDISNERI